MVDVIAMHMGLGLSSSVSARCVTTGGSAPACPLFTCRIDMASRTWCSGSLDHERATELGLPTSYDYGNAHQLADSPGHELDGDDGWLWKLSCQSRAFNFMGIRPFARARSPTSGWTERITWSS